jgi:hypothetical protein
MPIIYHLHSVSTAINPHTLLTYPINKKGERLGSESKLLKELDGQFWDNLSDLDLEIAYGLIQRFRITKAFPDLMAIDSISSLADITHTSMLLSYLQATQERYTDFIQQLYSEKQTELKEELEVSNV